MDEITTKRLEKDVKKLSTMGGNLLASMESMMSNLTAADLPALVAKQQELTPSWASGLTDISNLLVGFVCGRLRTLGAPADYAMRLLVAVLDEHATEIWPQLGAQDPEPEWLKYPATCIECGNEDHSDIVADMARQCANALVFAFREYETIALADGMDLESARARALEQVQFQAVITQAVLPPL